MELTGAIHGEIVEHLRAGNHLETAAAAAGIPIRAARAWLELGADPESAFAAFRRDVLAAMSYAETQWVGALNAAASCGEYKAAQWLLERRYPHWSIKVRQAVEREQEDAIARVVALEPELGAEVVNRILAALSGEGSEAPSSGAEGDELH